MLVLEPASARARPRVDVDAAARLAAGVELVGPAELAVEVRGARGIPVRLGRLRRGRTFRALRGARVPTRAETPRRARAPKRARCVDGGRSAPGDAACARRTPSSTEASSYRPKLFVELHN